MVSKTDLVIGLLVLIAGIIIYEFAPGGVLFMGGAAHATTHYVGSALALLFGFIGLAMYKKLSMVGLAVSVLSIVLGVVFLFDAPGMVLYTVLKPHGMAMQATGGVSVLVGLLGMVGSAVIKPKK
jgi:hypothetical protein